MPKIHRLALADLIDDANEKMDALEPHMFSGARPHTNQHQQRCLSYEMQIIDLIQKMGHVVGPLSELQANIHGANFHSVPFSFKAKSDMVELHKSKLVSKVVFK